MLMALAAGLFLYGTLFMLWRMFATNLLWGLAGLLVSAVAFLLFALLHWEQARRPLAYLLAAIVLGLLAAATGSHPGEP